MQNNLIFDLNTLCNQFYSSERDSEKYKFNTNQLLNKYGIEILKEIFKFSEMFYVSILIKHNNIIRNLKLNNWIKFMEGYSSNESDFSNILEFIYKYLSIDSLILFSKSRSVSKEQINSMYINYIKYPEKLLISEFFKSEYQEILIKDIQKITDRLKMEGGLQAKSTKKEIIFDLKKHSKFYNKIH